MIANGELPREVGAYRQAKEQIAQLERELAEFRASSLELEQELEIELEEKEKIELDLRGSVKSLSVEVAQWKHKYLELQKEYSATQTSLQKQISSLQEAHKSVSLRLREIEMVNDHMEQHERITKTSLEQVEERYHESLEKIALLEAELAGKDAMSIELQRSRDELRDLKEELSVIRHRSEKENWVPQAAESKIGKQDTRRTPAMGISHSKSLRKIHTMANKMADIQSRVTNFKSALPLPPSTPKGSASIGSRSPAGSSGSPSPTNIPVASARMRQNANNDDSFATPLHSRGVGQRWLETIEGSPTDVVSPGPRRSTKLTSSYTSKGGSRTPNINSAQFGNKEPASGPASRPGSAFSALHARPAFGHGRF